MGHHPDGCLSPTNDKIAGIYLYTLIERGWRGTIQGVGRGPPGGGEGPSREWGGTLQGVGRDPPGGGEGPSRG